MATAPVLPARLWNAWNHLGNGAAFVLPRELRKANRQRRATLAALIQQGRRR